MCKRERHILYSLIAGFTMGLGHKSKDDKEPTNDNGPKTNKFLPVIPDDSLHFVKNAVHSCTCGLDSLCETTSDK